MIECFGKVTAAWPIAPKTDQLLANLSRDVKNANKILLISGSAVVELTRNKVSAYQMLNQMGVSCDDCQLIQLLEDYQQHFNLGLSGHYYFAPTF
ncbi:MAG: hypothetical protein V3U75_00690 [Methylococcaceae bacterium]